MDSNACLLETGVMVENSDTKLPKSNRMDVIKGLVDDLRSKNDDRGVDMTPDQVVDAAVARFIEDNKVGVKGENR